MPRFPTVPVPIRTIRRTRRGSRRRKDITVEQVFRPTPGTYVEVAHQLFMLQRVAGGIERISSAMLPLDQSGDR